MKKSIPEGGGIRRCQGIAWYLLFCGLALCVVATDAVPRLAVLRAARGSLAESVRADGAAGPCRTHDVILPATAIDARWWIMHARQGMENGTWRVHRTDTDNAPDGRDVHWCSGLPLFLRAIATCRSWFDERPPRLLLQESAYFAGPLLFLVTAAVLSSFSVPRYGWTLSGAHILLLATAFPYLEMFRAGEADHHGLAAACALLSVMAMCAGFDASDARRNRWAVISGFAGAAGLWISAATQIPVLAACAAGGLAAAIHSRRAGEVQRFFPWRIWGATGATVSLVFYCLEYIPWNLGWRLEVNHPVHSMAWLGAGILLDWLCGGIQGKPMTPQGIRKWLVLGLAVAAVALPLVLTVIFGPRVFVLSDTYLSALHHGYIRECAPLWRSAPGDWSGWLDLLLWPSWVVAALGLLRRYGKPLCARNPSLILVLSAALLLQVLALLQIRWSGLATAAWSLAVLEMARVLHTTGAWRGAARPARMVLMAAAMIGLLGLPLQTAFAWHEWRANPGALPRNLVPGLILRDIGHRLANGAGGRRPVVLTDPTSATDLAYFGGVQVLGTFYWENHAGLKKTSEVFAARDAETALRMLRKYGVTHLVLPSWDAFSDGFAHIDLLKRAGAIPTRAQDFFWPRVLAGHDGPDWLRPFAYAIPAEFGAADQRVLIFEVVPSQSAAEAAMYRGIYHAETGDPLAARDSFRRVLESNPDHAEAHRWLAAMEQILQSANQQ